MFRRKVLPTQLISLEVAQQICGLSHALGRQIGLLINRRGHIEHVMIGDVHRIYLPDIGRVRAGQTRLRGLRHIHTQWQHEQLSDEDISDLELLRLDFVAGIAIAKDGKAGSVTYAHILPPQPGATQQSYHIQETVSHLSKLRLDVLSLLLELEAQLGKQLADVALESTDKEKGILVHVGTHGRAQAKSSLAELRELALTAGLPIVDEVIQLRKSIDPRLVLGKGKLEEVVLIALHKGAEILVFDRNLSPSQVRSLSDITDLKIIDRTQLILDIFAQRATTKDGKLQVELAQLKYTLPRLISKNTAMSRLTGGIGGRGPGETKLEINRRRARDKITVLEKEIDRIANQRKIRRQARKKNKIPVVSIVGYTNAGKSTLLNLLTKSNVLSEDKLFATLDPASRRVRFPKHKQVVITDTVGFIRDLPLDLISAFRATLEELTEADLLIHLMDASDPELEEKALVVTQTLKDLHVDHIPLLEVYNKTDLIPAENLTYLEQNKTLTISALQQHNIDYLITILEDHLLGESSSFIQTDRTGTIEVL